MPQVSPSPEAGLAPRAATRGLDILFAALGSGVWVGLLYLYNLWPGHLREMASRLLELGIVECFARQGVTGGLVCGSMGYPDGYHVAFGLPLLLTKAAVVQATGVAPLTSDTLVDAVCLAAGLAGAVALMRLLGINRWLALLAAYLYLSSPVVYGQGGYGAMRMAFVLVPSYLWLDERFRLVLTRGGWSGTALASWVLLVVAAKVFSLFMDGYSFVMATLASGALLLVWMAGPLRARRMTTAAVGIAAFVGGLAVAYASYTAYFPGGSSFAVMSVDLFRGQGTDLYALVVPSTRFISPLTAGWTQHVSAWQAYTDGPPLTDTYLGMTLVAGALLGVVLWLSGKRQPVGVRLPVVVAVGLVALVIALGPSLKIADFREPGTFDMRNPAANYMMPREAATLDLGTAWLYQHVPGVKIMRALYRWHVLVRIGLIAAFVFGIQLLLERRHGRVLAAVLCAVALVELLPNAAVLARYGTSAHAMLQQFDEDIADPVAQAIVPGERVLVQPCLLTTARNDWMANYVCAHAGARCYNAGGDKSIGAAALGWPLEVRRIMANAPDTLQRIDTLFTTGQLDAVVFVPFGLWEQAYSWPPSEARATEGLAACRAMLGPAAMTDARSAVVLRAGEVHRRIEESAAAAPPAAASAGAR